AAPFPPCENAAAALDTPARPAATIKRPNYERHAQAFGRHGRVGGFSQATLPRAGFPHETFPHHRSGKEKGTIPKLRSGCASIGPGILSSESPASDLRFRSAKAKGFSRPEPSRNEHLGSARIFEHPRR